MQDLEDFPSACVTQSGGAGIAIIVPVFKHSVLLFDAIGSLADLLEVWVVIVDDGCPNIETQFAGLGLAALYPRVIYLRQANRGLSGARNRGIDYVMDRLPEVEAIYFLDADNMLSEWSLAQMRSVLARQPEADWFYPDIRMFGLEWESSYAGPFSPLAESLMNVCEAGSLVRRRVFESGIRFSEELRLGFEDWDFWLTAIEHGFRGRHFENAGFRYRKRPESMLANATRDEARIRGQLESNHPWLIDLKWAVAAEHESVPRYAIYFTDLDRVRLASSGELPGEELSRADYLTRFWGALRAPNITHAGAILIVTSSANFTALAMAGLLTWCLFDLEVRLRDSNIAVVQLGRDAGLALSVKTADTGPAQSPVLAGISTELLRAIAVDSAEVWIQSALSPEPGPIISRRLVCLPKNLPVAEPMGDMLRDLVRLCSEIRLSPFAAGAGLPAQETAIGTPDLARVNSELRAKFGNGVLPPALHRRGPELAFAIPHAGFGGVEKVTFAVASALRRRGFTVSLVVIKSQEITFGEALREAFDRIFFLDNPEFEDWTGPSYLGTALSQWSVSGEHADALNLLSIFDAVIACHAADIMGLMGKLQRRGVVTGAYNHLFDETPTGRHCGHPHIALAFEHALDMLVCCSRNIASLLYAHGVPATKIVTVKNASCLDVAPAALRETLAARLARTGGRLNVLFLGRLDPQKGLDRLAEICARLRGDDSVHIRIIGQPVLGQDIQASALAPLVEEAVYGNDVRNVYTWADVLILPSLYEGLPLTIIEAAQLGVLPIVARSGAIDEVIDHGVNGFIVSQENCVAEMLSCISLLAADPKRLSTLQMAAAAPAPSWDDAVAPLDQKLRTALHTALRKVRLPVPMTS